MKAIDALICLIFVAAVILFVRWYDDIQTVEPEPTVDVGMINARNIEVLREHLQDVSGKQIVFMANPAEENHE